MEKSLRFLLIFLAIFFAQNLNAMNNKIDKIFGFVSKQKLDIRKDDKKEKQEYRQEFFLQAYEKVKDFIDLEVFGRIENICTLPRGIFINFDLDTCHSVPWSEIDNQLGSPVEYSMIKNKKGFAVVVNIGEVIEILFDEKVYFSYYQEGMLFFLVKKDERMQAVDLVQLDSKQIIDQQPKQDQKTTKAYEQVKDLIGYEDFSNIIDLCKSGDCVSIEFNSITYQGMPYHHIDDGRELIKKSKMKKSKELENVMSIAKVVNEILNENLNIEYYKTGIIIFLDSAMTKEHMCK